MWICERGDHCVDSCDGCEYHIEVEQVVRCKCCMFRSPIDDDYTRLQCPTGFICQLTNKLVRESDFCSYGKREVDV